MRITIVIAIVVLLFSILCMFLIHRYLNQKLNDIDGFEGVMKPKEGTEDVVLYFGSREKKERTVKTRGE